MIKNLGLRFVCVIFLSSEVVILLEFGFLLKIDGSECSTVLRNPNHLFSYSYLTDSGGNP